MLLPCRSALMVIIAVGTISATGYSQSRKAPVTPETSTQEPEKVKITADQQAALTASLEALLADHQYLLLEQQLGAPDTPDTPDTRFLRGLLLNRKNKPAASIQLLEPLADQFEKNGNKEKAQELRKTLAQDYLRIENYAKAARAYQLLLARYENTLTADEKEEMQLPMALLPLLSSAPAQTVDAPDSFRIPTERDSLGMTETAVYIDGFARRWMLDPASPFNYLSLSTAKMVGLKLSEMETKINGMKGKPILVHTSLIPRMKIGNITLRNVSVVVFNDEDLYYEKTDFHVQGVLGYPGFTALGSVTIYPDDSIEANKKDRIETGSPFYIEGDRLLAALGPKGKERIYEIDTGGQQSFLSSRYYDEHSDDFEGKKMQLLAVPGTENEPPAPAYVGDTIKIPTGDGLIELNDMQVLTEPRGKNFDDTYGTLGIYALDQLASYTFDYRTMQFYARSDSQTHLRVLQK